MKTKSSITFSVIIVLLLSISYPLYSQIPCENGFAGDYPCDRYGLQDHLTESDLGANFVNDSWGWTDETTGKEYALIGLNNGTAFIDISAPNNVVLLGTLPTHTSSSTWRDVKVFEDFAFIVSEASGHGMQVFDLKRLRDVSSPPETFIEDAHYSGFGNAHNIVINTESAYAYAVGTSTFSGGPHFIDISDPINPTAAGGYSNNNYSHDAQIVTYNGPDTDYIGREIFIGSNENVVAIVDITDKGNPIEISTISYPTIGYTHQGWFTEDQRYFLLGDETDEIGFGFNTRTLIFDFNDLDNPSLSFEYEGPTQAIDHNGYVVNDLFYLANYRAGMRVIDISSISDNSITEVGFFDTYPASNSASFNGGLWNVYPFFESGNIVLSGGGGFFLIALNENLAVEENLKSNTHISIYPNPATNELQLKSNEPIGGVVIYNLLGQEMLSQHLGVSGRINIEKLARGIYIVKTSKGSHRVILQ
ncbi:choice-of-anchor B family protein [Dokdonia sp. Hel_I_53]|uniref:choice-of-anchor B family protein n=1 Tax=Dokdonia sp. Hel_I_53 TaxID=1566287 RepID=UPI001198FB15|nr:choice-of-anchor B family protein [Dokdonia sp. Hel_I_53]TVZ52318.1 choice-of-anchor B domain-containing protein [Dokdonia sp. Hel_I_53]